MSIGVRYMQNPYIAFCDQCPDWTEGTRSYGAAITAARKHEAECHNDGTVSQSKIKEEVVDRPNMAVHGKDYEPIPPN